MNLEMIDCLSITSAHATQSYQGKSSLDKIITSKIFPQAAFQTKNETS